MKLFDSNGGANHVVPVSSGMLKPPHVKKIGPAMALFLKYEDLVTTGENADGIVLGGKPVTDDELAAMLGLHVKTVGKHRRRLATEKYVVAKRTPTGFVIRVRKSKKWTWVQGRKQPPKPTKVSEPNRYIPEPFGSALGTDRLQAGAKSLHPDQTKRGRSVDEAAERAFGSSEFWNLIGVPPQKMPPEFRELCEGLYANKNGQPMGEFVGVCMDVWESRRNKIPPQFAKAAAEIREREKVGTHQREPMREPQAEPWGAGSGVRQ